MHSDIRGYALVGMYATDFSASPRTALPPPSMDARTKPTGKRCHSKRSARAAQEAYAETIAEAVAEAAAEAAAEEAPEDAAEAVGEVAA